MSGQWLPDRDYCVIALLSQRVKVEDFEKKFVKLLCWSKAFSLFLFSKNNFRFFSDYFFLSFCIWRNLVAGLRGRTSRRSRLVFATPKGCRPRYLVDTSIKIKSLRSNSLSEKDIYVVCILSSTGNRYLSVSSLWNIF